MKKSTKEIIKYTAIIAVSLMLLVILYYGITSGGYNWIPQTFFGANGFKHITPGTLQNQLDSSYWLKIDIQPSQICLGDFITATVTSNINDGQCRIFFNPNNEGWKPLTDLRLDGNGNFIVRERVFTIGSASFIAICCDSEWKCMMSNSVRLSVIDCINPDSPTYTCGQTYQCSGSCPPTYGCYEYIWNTYRWCACANGPQGDGSGSIHPDWLPGGQYYNPTEYTQRLTCEEIKDPRSQSDCDVAYDPLGGTCEYVAGGFGYYCVSSTTWL